MTRERRVEVEFLQRVVVVFDGRLRQDFEAREQCRRFAAAMRLDDADHDVVALVVAAARGLQHRIRLADARRRAEEDLQAPAMALLFFSLQLIGGGHRWRSGWGWCFRRLMRSGFGLGFGP